jgi:hypothetical protein
MVNVVVVMPVLAEVLSEAAAVAGKTGVAGVAIVAVRRVGVMWVIHRGSFQ